MLTFAMVLQAAAMQPTLVDHPIVSSGGPPIYLDGTAWTTTRNAARKVNAPYSKQIIDR